MYLGFITKIGPLEIGIILLVVLLIFGPAKLPQIGSAIGKGIRELRNASKDIKEQMDVSLDEESSEGTKS